MGLWTHVKSFFYHFGGKSLRKDTMPPTVKWKYINLFSSNPLGISLVPLPCKFSTFKGMALSDSTSKSEGFVILVPDYNLQESSSQLILSVHAPLCRPNNISVFLDNNVVVFEAHPYLLRLKLPCSISIKSYEEGFDKEKGTYNLTLRKGANINEEYTRRNGNYFINESFSHSNVENETDCGKQLYGFANTFSGKLGLFYEEFSRAFNLEDPDNTKEEERTWLRQKEEEEKWSEDHYLADFMEDEHIKPLLEYIPHWCLSKLKDLNQDEKEFLESIPKIKSLESDLPDNQRNLAEFQMIDILLSYCYNKRTTEGENSVESGWTISKLSSSLSWFEVFKDLKSVLLGFYKRSLTYPLYRNWELTKIIHKDVVRVLKLGSSQVTRCFIEIRELFNETEHFHILNTLFIDPFCHFSNALSQEKLSELAHKIETIEIQKEEVHEDLLILELAAKVTLEEELSRKNKKKINEITEKMSTMNVGNSGNTSSSDSENGVSTSESSRRSSCK